MGQIKVSRYDSEPATKPIRPTETTLRICEVLFWHGYTSSIMLKARVGPHIETMNFNSILRRMKRQPNKFIKAPVTQRDNADAYYRPLYYQITPKGIQWLLDNGRITPDQADFRKVIFGRGQQQHFWHDALTGYITNDIALKANFINTYDALSKGENFSELRPLQIDGAVPDAFFGIKYKTGYRFFALETDMATEQIRRRQSGGSSLERKFELWGEILRTGSYKKAYGTPNLFILFATINETRMHETKNLVENLAGKSGWKDAILFTSLPHPREKLVPSGGLFGPWGTVNGGAGEWFDISKV